MAVFNKYVLSMHIQKTSTHEITQDSGPSDDRSSNSLYFLHLWIKITKTHHIYKK